RDTHGFFHRRRIISEKIVAPASRRHVSLDSSFLFNRTFAGWKPALHFFLTTGRVLSVVFLCASLENTEWATRSIGWTQSTQIGQVLYHGRDGHATKPSWHGRLARELTGRYKAHSR